MSEYQYYEFAAIDRPLTRAEMAELRAVSTRAVITPAGFTNHYEWGDLKADPATWMRRYFDAFVYTANWCSCRLSLRVPSSTFPKEALRPFAVRDFLSYRATKTHWVIDWALDESENYDRFTEDDGRDWMRRLHPLRDELLRGDLRPLYLGWLAGSEALHGGALEPVVPPGLADLSPAQQALAEFMEVDPDLLDAACAGSAMTAPAGVGDARRVAAAWLDTWKDADMRMLLERIALGRAPEVERQVKSHYAEWLKAQHPSTSPNAPRRRRVAELRELARSKVAARSPTSRCRSSRRSSPAGRRSTPRP